MEINFTNPELREAVTLICRSLDKAYLIGGCVRDSILNLPVKDIDIEVYGKTPDEIIDTLRGLSFEVDVVGASFGVIKVKHLDIDVSVPRTEKKTGISHKDFSVAVDPHMSIEEACKRRDFTINAIMYDFNTGEILDPVGGLADLHNKIIRKVSSRFSEDPLRVLRAMQFVARFDFDVEPETLETCRSLVNEFDTLPKERVFEEFSKMILKGKKISRGLTFLKDSGWIKHFPEIAAIDGVPQDPRWHEEGHVLIHTGLVCDSFAENRIGDTWEDTVVGFACLCHDFGKATTTVIHEDGKISSCRHESAGEAPTISFMERLTNQQDLIDQIIPLVTQHMVPHALFCDRDTCSDRAVRRLAARVSRIDRLVRVCAADKGGRYPKQDDDIESLAWLVSRAEALNVKSEAPKPIVMGRHLIELGLTPGKHFSTILGELYNLQIDGVFGNFEEGKALIAERYL